MKDNNMNALKDQDMEKVAGGMISEAEALDAALAHAGLTKEQVEFVKKMGLDYEHGRKVYEIEFYHNGFEYEFDVDAETGRVMKYKKDWD